MGGTELTVLVVDDDFRVANMHSGIVNALPGFTVTTTATTLAAARKADPVDLALVDVYLPDGSGIDFVRELQCDSMVLSAATDAPTIRAAVAAGALSYVVKPFAPADLAARLSGYARYRKILAGTNLGGNEVDAALDALRPRIAPAQSPTAVASPTKQLVLQALRASGQPMSSAELSAEVGVSRATAQRYLSTLANSGEVKIQLRYGTTGRPEQEFVAVEKPPNRPPRGASAMPRCRQTRRCRALRTRSGCRAPRGSAHRARPPRPRHCAGSRAKHPAATKLKSL
jgi:response regulator of citrate/malate metabolism